MGILTGEMKRMVREQRLGSVATVCADGTPTSLRKAPPPSGTTSTSCSQTFAPPATVANLANSPTVEIHVVDPLVRKGYRFKGRATTHNSGPLFEKIVSFYRARGLASPIRTAVLVKVERAAALISPVYDLGLAEHEVRARWRPSWRALSHGGTATTGE